MAGLAEAIVFEHASITVWCDRERRLIRHQMHRACPGPTFKEALTAGLDAMRRHGCDRWLSDDRQHVALAPEVETWSHEVWSPAAQAAGWRYWAIVKPVSAVGNLSSARLQAFHSSHGITARMFSDVDEAYRWLADLPVTPPKM